ncbi:MAG: IclR family transcriptional regulator [Candidatus Microbacterium stercoravium]
MEVARRNTRTDGDDVPADYRPPPYAIASVDSALRAIHLLRDSGSVRVTDLAVSLGVSVSSAHRIVSMLVYQGFAVQDNARRYVAGPALCAPVIMSQRNQDLAVRARPVLEELRDTCGETVNLAVRIGIHTRVLQTILGGPDSLGDRTGHVYPAHSTSAGKALLAIEPTVLVDRLYDRIDGRAVLPGDPPHLGTLHHELERTRIAGYAVCREEVQRNISSIAVPVFPESGPPAAIVLLMTAKRLTAFLAGGADAVAPLILARHQLETALSAV